MDKAKVILVGAGPGDPGLLTVKGKEVLEAADVVIYDRLISEDTLAYAAGAKMIYVGKEQGHHPVPQDRINEILLEEARHAKRIVRLKGGDPYLFGRGGEEADFLAEHGIPVEIIPGVTSALAAPSYAGIPPTYRRIASSVHIITGHGENDRELDIDFEALVRTKGTLIFLMAVATTPGIVQGLKNAGMPESTSAAMVENGTLPKQRKIQGNLNNIVELAKEKNITSPAILIVGGVCNASDALDWFSARPLFGKTIVVTRPKSRAGILTDKLKQLGADVIALPCIESKPIENKAIDEELNHLDQYSWLVLTSPQGAEILFAHLTALGKDARALAPVKIAAVGKATAQEFEDRGITPDYMPEEYDALHLTKGLLAQLSSEDNMLLLRAEKAVSILPEKLSTAGIPYKDIPLYSTKCISDKPETLMKKLAENQIDYVTFTSASTVEGFSEGLAVEMRKNFTAACIGDASESAARNCGYTTIKASNGTIDCLIQSIIEDCKVEDSK